jgi:hypothetical protein
MGQSIFINFDSETLTSRCRGLDDLRTRKFSPFVAGDSIVFDLFLTGTSGLLNIQDYTTRIGVGNLNARPESGEYLVGGFTLDYNNSAVDLEATIESATGNGCSVIELSPFVFKVSFDAVGAQTIPAIDSSDLSPRSTVDRQTLQVGDATTKEIWLWRLYANPIAFTDVFTNIAGDGVQGTIALSTAGIYDLLGDNASVKTFFEVELTDSVGDIITVMQTSIVLTGEVIGEGFTGYIPSPSMPAEATTFLESFPDPTIVGDLTVGGFALPTGAADGYVLTSNASGSGSWAESVGITPQQAADITANNAKVGITPTQASDITTNNAKVGITSAQASDITTNATNISGNSTSISYNLTAVTLNAAEIATNTADIAINTAKVGITTAQADAINTALQPTDPTLQSVTNNGATTGNDIAVGGRITTGNNSATGGNAIALGGANNFATGAGSEVLGGDYSTASGTGSTVIGGSGQTVSGNWSISLGGLNGDISSSRGAIIGGSNNTLTHNDSAMIATLNQSSVANNTTHVYNLHAFGGITMPTGATDSYVLTSDASGVGTWQANEKVSSDTTGEAAGSDSVLNMVSLTQAEYDTALANFPATIKATTLYIIKS